MFGSPLSGERAQSLSLVGVGMLLLAWEAWVIGVELAIVVDDP